MSYSELTPAEAGMELHRYTEEYVTEHPGTSYEDALTQVCIEHSDLMLAYSSLGDQHRGPEVPAEGECKAKIDSLKVHKRILEHMLDSGERDYGQAMDKVLNDDPALKEAYART